jgi:membrane-anchored protein YejM (alkaline phosphatase superfamily)
MKETSLSRRDLLKIAGITPLVGLELSRRNSRLRFNPYQQKSPNILVLVFDSLSAKNVSLYGYPRKTTPNFERFAQKSTVYHRHYSSGNFTTPGTASLLTGVYPWTHRAMNMRDQTLPQFTDQNIFSLLNQRYHTFAYTHNTFAYIHLDQFRKSIDNLLKISDLTLYSDSFTEKLADPDYFIANEAELLSLKNENASSSSLFLSLFDKEHRLKKVSEINQAFHKQYPRGLPNCPTGKDSKQCYTVENTFEWLQAQVATQTDPFFGYVHINPPHAPYNPQREFIGIFKDNFKTPEKP